MVAEGFTLEDILKSDRFADRTPEAIRAQIVRLEPSFFEKIAPANNVLTIETVVKLFSSAFGQLCASKAADKATLDRFRMIFRAARDYGPLLAHFEKWDKIEKRIDGLEATLAELQAAKGA